MICRRLSQNGKTAAARCLAAAVLMAAYMSQTRDFVKAIRKPNPQPPETFIKLHSYRE
jgi:hypothetical protein